MYVCFSPGGNTKFPKHAQAFVAETVQYYRAMGASQIFLYVSGGAAVSADEAGFVTRVVATDVITRASKFDVHNGGQVFAICDCAVRMQV